MVSADVRERNGYHTHAQKPTYTRNQELMKEGASNSALQLGTAFESERLRHFPYMDIFSSGEYPVRLRRKCCFHSHALIARATQHFPRLRSTPLQKKSQLCASD